MQRAKPSRLQNVTKPAARETNRQSRRPSLRCIPGHGTNMDQEIRHVQTTRSRNRHAGPRDPLGTRRMGAQCFRRRPQWRNMVVIGKRLLCQWPVLIPAVLYRTARQYMAAERLDHLRQRRVQRYRNLYRTKRAHLDTQQILPPLVNPGPIPGNGRPGPGWPPPGHGSGLPQRLTEQDKNDLSNDTSDNNPGAAHDNATGRR